MQNGRNMYCNPYICLKNQIYSVSFPVVSIILWTSLFVEVEKTQFGNDLFNLMCYEEKGVSMCI